MVSRWRGTQRNLFDVTAYLVRSGRCQSGLGGRVHCGTHDADELVFYHDAVQDGDGPLHAIFVLGVFERSDDGDESSEGLEAAFDALGGSGGCKMMFRGQAIDEEVRNILSPPFTMLH